MNFRSYLFRIAVLLVLAIVAATLVFLACGKGEKKNENSNPEIVGCNSVKYQGVTYTNIGCAQGIASFDVTITQNNRTASFHITCSNGCVSSVSVIGGNANNNAITAP